MYLAFEIAGFLVSASGIQKTQHQKAATMENFIKKIEQLGGLSESMIWVAILVLFGFIFRKPLLNGMSALRAPFRTPHSKEASGQNGNELKKNQTPNNPNNFTESPSATSDTIDPELMKLAEVYSNLDIQNRVASIRAKDAIARDMADLVIRKKISRDTLAGENNEGILLALAATIRTHPESKDAERLLRVAHKTSSHHVKYRMALAFGMLLAKKMVSPSLVHEINQVMTAYEKDADAPLLHRLKHTEKMLSLYSQPLDS